MILNFTNFYKIEVNQIAINFNGAQITRQVYNLFQEPVEQPPLGFSIAEEKIRQF